MAMFPWDWAAIGTAALELLDTDAGRAFREGMTAQAVERSRRAWQRVEWAKEEEQYRSRLLPFVRTTRLLGNPKAIDIDALFSEVFVFGDVSAHIRSGDLRDPRRDGALLPRQPRERKSARQLVERGAHVYILGHPGAGKTTFLRYVAVLCCKGILESTPVYIELNDATTAVLARSNDGEVENAHRDKSGRMRLVRDAIDRAFGVCRVPDEALFVEALLARGRTILLLDGLDEVPVQDGVRDSVISEIRQLQRQYPNTQICLTCRLAASEYTFEHFSYAEIAPFTVEQQRTFISKWFVDDQVKRSVILGTWQNDSMAQLRDLGKTPLLLALICLSFDEVGHLPERHADLFREALDALFKRWDSSRSVKRDQFYGGLTPYRREQMVQEVAAELFVGGKYTFVLDDVRTLLWTWYRSIPELRGISREELQVEKVLRQIESQHGVIIQRYKDEFSFAHLSIQEFLCARSIREGHPERPLAKVATTWIFDPRWREVIIFTAGLLQDGSEFLRMLVESLRTFVARSEGVAATLREAEAVRFAASSTNAPLASGSKVAKAVLDLVERIDSLTWIGPSHPLRSRVLDFWAAFAAQPSVERECLEYVRVSQLIIDCAAVSTCPDVDELIAPLFTSTGEYVRWRTQGSAPSDR